MGYLNWWISRNNWIDHYQLVSGVSAGSKGAKPKSEPTNIFLVARGWVNHDLSTATSLHPIQPPTTDGQVTEILLQICLIKWITLMTIYREGFYLWNSQSLACMWDWFTIDWQFLISVKISKYKISQEMYFNCPRLVGTIKEGKIVLIQIIKPIRSKSQVKGNPISCKTPHWSCYWDPMQGYHGLN